MPSAKSYTAVVQNVVPRGRHGPYAVAKSDEVGLITFSLDSPVWEEEDWPDPGSYVVLTRVRKKRAGWRAQRGRFLDPSDEA